MRFFSRKKKPEPKKTNARPIDTFFHLFILDTIHRLPTEKKEILKKVDLDKVYLTDFNDWKKTIKKVLNLSETIEIAIKDLWLRNSEIAKRDNIELNPEEFALLVTEKFLAENSKIDVWENESDLINAKKRISESYLSE
ncbi:hypothetical protein [Psychroserpens luteus]|uniref:Uncharacterized protein n=1 Tax=Psychroserpens luteus TaxID=1434066 RepID=A0ABW5ZQJ1_9FLAO|nr:hypothetical protein [Psychroserpens luteus]